MSTILVKVAYDAGVENVDWLDPLEARAWRGFRRIITLMPPRIERDLRVDAQLSVADYEVLSNLSEQENHSYRLMDLAERLLWSRSRLSHHLERMEARNLITRRSSPEDGRGAVAELTEHGLATIVAAAPSHVASVRSHFIDLLTPSELEVLGDLSERVVAHLESSPQFDGDRDTES